MVMVGVVCVVGRTEWESGVGRIVEMGEGVLIAFPSLKSRVVNHPFIIYTLVSGNRFVRFK